jgi:hypothetical protein
VSPSKKEQLESKLITELHIQARNQGYTCAGIGDTGYRRIHRMTQVQLQDEIDRIVGIKSLDQMPSDHTCITVG